MKPSTILIMCAIAAIVTFIRQIIASRKAKQEDEEAAIFEEANRERMNKKLSNENMHADEMLVDQNASACLDTCAKKLIVTENGSAKTYLFDDIASIELIDHSHEYFNAVEMHRYYAGIERCSLYKPYGSHSTKEVRDGEDNYYAFIGKIVYGIKITQKNQAETVHAFFIGIDNPYGDNGLKKYDLERFIEKCKKNML